MQWMSIGFPIQCNHSADYFCFDVVGRNRQCPVQSGGFLTVAPQKLIAQSHLLKREKIARIKLDGLFEVTQCFVVLALPAHNVGSQFENARIIGQGSTSDLQFSESSI